MISFEFPVTERVRLLLRLEDLFARLDHHLSAGAALDHHAALLTLFDLAELGGRVDIKGELLQELERQKQLLDTLREVDTLARMGGDEFVAVLPDQIEAEASVPPLMACTKPPSRPDASVDSNSTGHSVVGILRLPRRLRARCAA